MTDHERDQAIKEGHRNQSADAYFEARTYISGDQRAERVFCDGFDRGWDAGRPPLLERIAELERQLAETKKDAERFRFANDSEEDFSICYWDKDAGFNGGEWMSFGNLGDAVELLDKAIKAKEQP